MNKLLRPGFKALVSLIYRGYGIDVFGRYRWLMDSLSWPPEKKRAWQLQRLNYIIDFSWEHVPFYREYWGDHKAPRRPLQSLEELQLFPALPKKVFRANAPRIRPDNLSTIRYMEWHTGGTTGEPVHYGRDVEQWGINEGFHLWGWEQAGYELGDPVGVIAGGSLLPERKTLKSSVRAWTQQRLFLYGVAMDRKLAREYHARLTEFGAKFLYGYPSALFLFTKCLTEEGLSLPGVRAAFTTAEMLLPRYRQGIESVLGCKVFNNLGCNDGGYESYECPQHDGLHYNDLQALLEIGKPGDELEGHLLITNLWNRSTPFIRYENGDKVTLRQTPCPCGASFPVIASIDGRTADILTFGNGRSLSGPALTLIFGPLEIDGWQVVQTTPMCLEARLCTPREIKPSETEHIQKIFNFHLGSEVTVLIKRVDQLQLTKGGKLKPIWSEVQTAA